MVQAVDSMASGGNDRLQAAAGWRVETPKSPLTMETGGPEIRIIEADEAGSNASDPPIRGPGTVVGPDDTLAVRSNSVTSVYSADGLSHGAPHAAAENAQQMAAAPDAAETVVMSGSFIDSLLMPLTSSGDTRTIGPDVVVMRDPFTFRHKYASFLKAGVGRLQVLVDFDRTLTSFWHNGRLTSSCHGTVEKSRFASEDYRQQTEALFQHYYPIEVSLGFNRSEKATMMVQWWQRAHDLMVENRIQREWLPMMVSESNLGLRKGARELLHELAQHDIPTLVFSAGIADVLVEFLRQQNCLFPNMHVVSNQMRFNDEGVLVGFKGELIHTMNKNAAALRNHPEPWAHDPERTHILLLGDNLGDIHMSDGLDYAEQISVGFLNDRVAENMSAYRSTFDAVILNDGSMELARQILGHMAQGQPSVILGGRSDRS